MQHEFTLEEEPCHVILAAEPTGSDFSWITLKFQENSDI
jgi:hypothetical protein